MYNLTLDKTNTQVTIEQSDDWGGFAQDISVKRLLHVLKPVLKTERQELKEWRRIGKSTAAAIKTIAEKWYADCYNTEADMQRLMAWENHINKLLNESGK